MDPPQLQMEGGYCTRRDSQAVKIALSNRQERDIKRDGKEGGENIFWRTNFTEGIEAWWHNYEI